MVCLEMCRDELESNTSDVVTTADSLIVGKLQCAGVVQAADAQKPAGSQHKSDSSSGEGNGESVEKPGTALRGALGKRRAARGGAEKQVGTSHCILGCAAVMQTGRVVLYVLPPTVQGSAGNNR